MIIKFLIYDKVFYVKTPKTPINLERFFLALVFIVPHLYMFYNITHFVIFALYLVFGLISLTYNAFYVKIIIGDLYGYFNRS